MPPIFASRSTDRKLPRRSVVVALAATLLAGPRGPRAQLAAALPRRVGILAPSTAKNEEVTLRPFFAQMEVLGWIEGRTVRYDRAYAGDVQSAMPHLAAELVARAPDVIYAPPAPAAGVAHQATRTIPIVFGTSVDPVGSGLVASRAHPGGNVTGISSMADSLAPKRVQLLHEMLPNARRIGLLGDPQDPTLQTEAGALARLSRDSGLVVVRADVSSAADLDAAVARLLTQRVDAVLTESAFAYNMRERMFALAQKARLPIVGHRSQMADSGALFAYGASLADQLRRSALLVDKVLRGVRPADIAVEQPTVFELVVNLKSARALGIAVPQALLLRADRVIE